MIQKHVHPVTGAKGYRIAVCRTVKGRRHRKLITVYCTLPIAKRMEVEIWDEMAHARPQEELTFGKLLKEYLAFSRQTKKTWYDDKCRAQALAAYFGDMIVTSIGIREIVAYQTTRKETTSGRTHRLLRPATVNREVTLISAMFTFAIRSGLIEIQHNPARYVQKLPEDSLVTRHITDELFLRILKATHEPHFARALLLARFTGLRLSHLLALDYRDITPEGLIYPPTSQYDAKKKMGRVPIRSGLEKIFGKHTKGPVIEYQGRAVKRLKTVVAATRHRSGVYFRFHDLRASFFAELVQYGIDPIIRDIWMGHGRDAAHAPTIQERYSRVPDSTLIKEMEKLPSCNVYTKCVLSMAK